MAIGQVAYGLGGGETQVKWFIQRRGVGSGQVAHGLTLSPTWTDKHM